MIVMAQTLKQENLMRTIRIGKVVINIGVGKSGAGKREVGVLSAGLLEKLNCPVHTAE